MEPRAEHIATFEAATEALRRETGVEMTINPSGPDGGIAAHITLGTTRIPVNIAVTGPIRDAQAALLAGRLEKADIPMLVVTPYVPPAMAKKLRQLGVQFIDAAGNAYLNLPLIQVFIYGNKWPNQKKTQAETGVFTKGGVKVVFALLCQPGLKDATYRQIAEAATVAVGTVNMVMKRLQYHRFLIDLGTRGRRLERTPELLERWVIAYAEQLRPKQLIGTYRPGQDVDWMKEGGPDGGWWGGEIAAANLTGYLKPAMATIYTRHPVKPFIHKYRLIADPHGSVELREVFWNFAVPVSVPDIVPPLLVYADLMATADPRNVETAKLIYDEHLQRHFR